MLAVTNNRAGDKAILLVKVDANDAARAGTGIVRQGGFLNDAPTGAKDDRLPLGFGKRGNHKDSRDLFLGLE